jgi:N-acetylmuramoyl-L-alanine amidase
MHYTYIKVSLNHQRRSFRKNYDYCSRKPKAKSTLPSDAVTEHLQLTGTGLHLTDCSTRAEPLNTQQFLHIRKASQHSALVLWIYVREKEDNQKIHTNTYGRRQANTIVI